MAHSIGIGFAIRCRELEVWPVRPVSGRHGSTKNPQDNSPCESSSSSLVADPDLAEDRAFLLARTNRSGQPAVIDSVRGVPQGLSQLNPSTKNFNLVGAAGWGIGRNELLVPLRDEVFVVTVPQNSFKNVLALAHISNFQFTRLEC